MYFGKLWIKSIIFGMLAVIAIFSVATYQTYRTASDIVDSVFPELCRLVAEDNCLDNTISYGGSTIYNAYTSKLQDIGASSPLIDFRSDAVTVPCTSRATAPQRGTRIPVKLVGHWTITFPLFGGIPIDLPIVREMNVIGIREYRDR